MKTKNKIGLEKINIFLRGAKDNNFSSAISNNSLKHSGSKSESEEINNTININNNKKDVHA